MGAAEPPPRGRGDRTRSLSRRRAPTGRRRYDQRLASPTTPATPGEDPRTFYAAVGGEPTFRRIVGRFYAEVARDEVLRPLYPEADLGPAEERLRLFLMQYWGGPQTYGQLRGHPRLRMRHAPFAVGPAERDAWLRAMGTAVAAADLAPGHADQLMGYFKMTADHMVNTPS